jgi:parallel beta-helix repeat protein
LVARGSSGSETIDTAGIDAGAFLNTLLASHETFCFAAGDYTLVSPIRIERLEGVTLSLDQGAVMNASSNNIVLVDASLGTVIRGGEWIGPGRGQMSLIRIQYGSNNTVVEGANISKAGRDGIILYQSTGPSFNVSILNNTLHNNGRYGVQEYSNTSVGMWGTVISGNIALNNRAGGIYTNGAGGVTIIRNIVRNTVGNGPGEIGIGVTNGFNDTVTLNRVDHMAWYGIQAFYNNYTVISDNISTFNAGAWDQSGITSDHSSYSTIVGNLVESNGKLGIYVERSWNVTVSGNIASYNHGYGIAFYHGSIPTMGRSVVSGNVCSFNSLGGIILNSAIDNVISMNQCDNNSGYGIFLYNDLGNAGSTGNLLFDNSLGNEGSAPPTQTFGIGEANNSDNNTLISNVMVNNTQGAESLIGPGAIAP